MKIKTVREIVKRLRKDISVLFRGPHGIGKSSLVYQLSSEIELPVLERRMSQLSEGDLIGLPFKVEKQVNGSNISLPYATRFLPMDWFVEAMERPFAIFLDELDRSSQEVLQATFELLLDRSIQGNKVHPDCRIFAAINGGQCGSYYNVNVLDPAMLDRVWIADLTPTIEEWITWGKENNEISSDILSFIEKNPEHLEDDLLGQKAIDPTKISPSRRSWHRLSKTLSEDTNKDLKSLMGKLNIDNDKFSDEINLLSAMCSGFVGLEATSLFVKFLSNKNKFFKAEVVLNEFDEHKKELKDFTVEEHNNLINRLEDYFSNEHEFVNDKQLANLAKYVNLLPKELVVSLVSRLSTIDPEKSSIEERKAITSVAADKIREIFSK